MPAPTNTGFSYTFYLGDGSSTTFPINFEYLDPTHVKVSLDGTVLTAGTHYQITNASVVFAVAPGIALPVQIVRQTPLEYDLRAVDFRAFGSITEDEMDLNQKQIWYLIQEASELDDSGNINPDAAYLSWDAVRSVWNGSRNGTNQRITDVADPALDADVATKGYVDSIAEFGFVGIPQTWTFTILPATNNYTLSNAPNLDANYLIVAVEGVLQTPNVDFTVTPGTTSSTLTFVNLPVSGQSVSVQNFGRSRLLPQLVLGDNAVATDNIQDAAVTSSKIAGAAVTETKLGTGAVTAEKIATAAVTEAKVASEAVSYAKLKKTGFATAPGGSFDSVLKVDRTTGALLLEPVAALDIQNWLTELGNVRLNTFAVPNANISLGGYAITNLASPTGGAGVGSPGTQAATKQYVLDQVAGANANNIELVDDFTMAGGTADIILIQPGSIPAWFTNSDYLYYTFAITNWVCTVSNTVQWQAYEGATWLEKGKFVGVVRGGTSATQNCFEITVVNPRTISFRASVLSKQGSNTFSADPVLGPLAGLRLLMDSGGLVTSSPRILVYGHKGSS